MSVIGDLTDTMRSELLAENAKLRRNSEGQRLHAAAARKRAERAKAQALEVQARLAKVGAALFEQRRLTAEAADAHPDRPEVVARANQARAAAEAYLAIVNGPTP